jgi:hypothetical protein
LAATPASTPGSGVRARLAGFRRLPSTYFGINFDYVQTAFLRSHGPEMDARLASLEPGTLRWPGGTEANNFQWRLGYPVKPPIAFPGPCKNGSGVGRHEVNGFRFTLPKLRAAYAATHAPPLFDLNMLDSTFADQLDMLHAARGLGVPVRYVELGNGLYNCNNEWVHYFPTAADYGRTVAADDIALHHAFPGVTVIAEAALIDRNSRERGWNSSMLNAAARGGGLPDAVAFQEYPSYGQALTTTGLPALFAEPYASTEEVDSALAKLPVHEPAWIAEYNMLLKHPPNSNPAQLTYAHGLFVAEMELLALRVRGSEHVDFWTAFGGKADSAYDGGNGLGPGAVLSPAGLAIEWVDQAAHSAVATAEIDFTNAPTLAAGGPPALVGQAFFSNTGQQDVLLNLTGQPVTVRAGAAIPVGSGYRQVTGDPTQPLSDASRLPLASGIVGKTITLPAYSITLLM